jgi:hypothetical protein
MSLSAYPTLLEKLGNKRYRRAFRAASVRNFVAMQIRVLRKAIFETQAKLGEACGGKPANVIARLENPNYGKMSVSTLLELADTFDVGLQIRFVPMEEMAIQIENLSDGALLVPTFAEEVQDCVTPGDSPWLAAADYQTIDIHPPRLGDAPRPNDQPPQAPLPPRLGGMADLNRRGHSPL